MHIIKVKLRNNFDLEYLFFNYKVLYSERMPTIRLMKQMIKSIFFNLLFTLIILFILKSKFFEQF
jgi:hypothetical protein